MDTAHKGKEPALILVRRRHVPEQAAVRAASAQRQAERNLLMQGVEPGPLAGFFISSDDIISRFGDDGHGITVGKEAVTVFNCLTVGVKDALPTSQCRNQKQQ